MFTDSWTTEVKSTLFQDLSDLFHSQTKAHLQELKSELLTWAGLHRGTRIDEEAMPRFHEIIDKIDELSTLTGERSK
jgi:hypothetical protein